MSDATGMLWIGAVVGFTIGMTLSHVHWMNTLESYESMTDICLQLNNKTITDEDYPTYLEQCKNASNVFTNQNK